MKKSPHMALVLTLLVVFTVSCSKQPEPTTETATDNHGARSVSIASVVLRPMAGSLTASGLLLPREEAAVGSELSGYRVAEVLVEEGAMVTKDQILARLDPGLLQARIAQARASIAQAKSQAAQAHSEAARVDGLDGKGILSDEQIASRRAAAKGSEASVQIAEAQLNELLAQSQRMTILAPVSGTVLERMVRPGDVASPSQPLFRIARDSLIELDAEVPEDAIARLSPGELASVTLPSGHTLDGTVRRISPRVDSQTKLGRVRVQLPVDAALRSGGFASVVFRRAATPVPAVIEKAVQFEASGPLLVVISADNHARRVPIKTGARADGFVAIEQGPPVGARVALGGGSFLLDGDLVNTVSVGDASKPQANVAQTGKH